MPTHLHCAPALTGAGLFGTTRLWLERLRIGLPLTAAGMVGALVRCGVKLNRVKARMPIQAH
ncbi:hypothetical protein AB6Q13_13460 [Ralstonia solanacearum]|uniref:hypothetical protein n=1 Tax=Ralstonia solanacearum TaxID=305 RepID=UPI000AD56438|nr:hypothetical protein [Ralstonia solanacearum]MDB0567871.1 hypothetical protein [Ralstonia solanacearum]MDB0577801.1 hypothetical protein [Ralstonia solanacearum]